MRHPAGVEVAIKCLDRDHIYPEYSIPREEALLTRYDSSLGEENYVEQYVPVSGGVRFSILVTFEESFDCRGCLVFRVGCQIIGIDNEGVMDYT